MSTGYTPETHEIRGAYCATYYDEIAAGEFDRWLLTHDAEIRTAALEEAAVIVRNNFGRSWVAWGTLGHLAAAIRAAGVDPL